jgi:hypothetical protein
VIKYRCDFEKRSSGWGIYALIPSFFHINNAIFQHWFIFPTFLDNSLFADGDSEMQRVVRATLAHSVCC